MWRRFGIGACVVLWSLAASLADTLQTPKPSDPQQVPGEYVTGNYGLIFQPPQKSFFCPLPKDWVGSDHGTFLFLKRPTACYGAGYPSSSRGFEPPTTARIEVYYGYAPEPDEEKPQACKVAGTAMLFGKKVSLCKREWQGMTAISASGRYTADAPAEFSATLVALPADQKAYMPMFLSFLASVHACDAGWTDSRTGKHMGFRGARCPRTRWF